jgi:uncharacterized membrane protein YedE/YeeE
MSATEILLPVSGGVLIGLAALMLIALNGRVMGMSGIWAGVVRLGDDIKWRMAFVAGLVAGPVLLALLGRSGKVEIDTPLPLFVLAGLLVGFGTALGSGCTSGHGICGISRLSPRSIVATLVFMGFGFATVFFIREIMGGAR